MRFNIIYICKHRKSILLFLACFIILEITYSQKRADSVDGLFHKNQFFIDIGFNMIPNGRVKVYEGSYSLYTKAHSVYSAEVGYKISIKPELFFTTGLTFEVIKSNFFGDISNAELAGTGIVIVDDAPPIIYYKGAYLKVGVPLLIGIKSKQGKSGSIEFNIGPKINYNGFSGGENIVMTVADTNNQAVKIFEADFKSNNDFKPWLSIIFTSGDFFYLKNKNIIGLFFSIDVGATKFLNADYRITFPNKPVSIGSYSVSGPILGFNIQYRFTGYNKRRIKEYEKKGF